MDTKKKCAICSHVFSDDSLQCPKCGSSVFESQKTRTEVHADSQGRSHERKQVIKYKDSKAWKEGRVTILVSVGLIISGFVWVWFTAIPRNDKGETIVNLPILLIVFGFIYLLVSLFNLSGHSGSATTEEIYSCPYCSKQTSTLDIPADSRSHYYCPHCQKVIRNR